MSAYFIGPAAVAREALAVEEGHVDIERAQRDALQHDVGPSLIIAAM